MSSSSRHKSCLACIQTKRKCDRILPRCQRCVARGSECHYIGQRRHEPQRNTDSSLENEVVNVPHLIRQASTSGQLESVSADSNFSLAMSTDTALLEFLNHPIEFGTILNSITSNNANLSIDSLYNNIITSPIPDGPTKITLPSLPSESRLHDRVEYVARRLSQIPRTFVEQGQTMFIHRAQFQRNFHPALQDAMNVSALHCMKTAPNMSFVIQSLQSASQQLIASIDVLTASKDQLLAALQALILYQFMRLFDGDIYLRAQAEADEETTLLWADHLRSHMCAENHLQLDTQDPIQAGSSIIEPGRHYSDWETWLLDESIRRTVITTFLLRGVYNYLKTGNDTPTDLRVYFSAQSALWGAQSYVHWVRAMEEKERLEIRVTQWDEEIVKAGAGDLEELGVLVMAMLWGLGATHGWLGYDVAAGYGFT